MGGLAAARSGHPGAIASWGLAGAGALTGSTLLYALATGIDVVAEGAPATTLEVLLLGIPAVGLLYAGYWLHAGEFSARQVQTIGALAAGTALVAALATVVSVVAAGATGLSSRASFLLLVATGSEGALVGVLLGAFAATEEYWTRERRSRDRTTTLYSLLEHNIRNRVTVMDGYLTKLVDSTAEYDRESADRIRTQHDAVLDLLEDARVVTEAVAEETELRTVDLAAVVEEQVDLLESTYEDVAVGVDSPAEAPVAADDLLAAAVENVLSNAVQHNDKPTAELGVSVTREGDRVTLRVADNGPGIDDDRKERVFDPEVGDGSGMGLYLVETLVERYGGEVWVADAEGGGAAVVITLPAA